MFLMHGIYLMWRSGPLSYNSCLIHCSQQVRICGEHIFDGCCCLEYLNWVAGSGAKSELLLLFSLLNNSRRALTVCISFIALNFFSYKHVSLMKTLDFVSAYVYGSASIPTILGDRLELNMTIDCSYFYAIDCRETWPLIAPIFGHRLWSNMIIYRSYFRQ